MMTPEKAAQLYEEFNGQGIEPGDDDVLDALLTLSQMQTVYPVQHRPLKDIDEPSWFDRHTWLHENSARESRRQLIDKTGHHPHTLRVTRRHYVEVDITDE